MPHALTLTVLLLIVSNVIVGIRAFLELRKAREAKHRFLALSKEVESNLTTLDSLKKDLLTKKQELDLILCSVVPPAPPLPTFNNLVDPIDTQDPLDPAPNTPKKKAWLH